MPNASPAFRGSCACGRITYTSYSVPFACAACHCITCRKLSGGPFQAFAATLDSKITYHDSKSNTDYPGLPANDSFNKEGGISFLNFAASSERAFCADCHTPLGMRYKHVAESHSVALGSVDEESIRDDEVRRALEPDAHIFCSQQAWWCKGIGKDDLPINERFTGTFEEDIKAWEKANGTS